MRRETLATALGGALVVVSGQGNAPVGQAHLQANDTGRARQRLSGHRNRLRHRGDYGRDGPDESIERTDARVLETNDEKRLRKKHKKETRDAADSESARQAHDEKRNKKVRNKELKLAADQGCFCDNGGSQADQYAYDEDDEEGERAKPAKEIFGSRLENEVNALISKLYETGGPRNLAGGSGKSGKDDGDDDNPALKSKSKSEKKSKKSPKTAKSAKSKGAKSKGSKSCVCSPTHAPSTIKGDYSTSFEGGPPFPEDYPGWSVDDLDSEPWKLSQERARTGDWSIKAPMFDPDDVGIDGAFSAISYTTEPDSGAGVFRMWYDSDADPTRQLLVVLLDDEFEEYLPATTSFQQYSLPMESGSHTVKIQYVYDPGLERRLQDGPQGGAVFIDDVSYEVLRTVAPSPRPSRSPSLSPTLSPTVGPSLFPTLIPTKFPTFFPTVEPTLSPTEEPSFLTSSLSYSPTEPICPSEGQVPSNNECTSPAHIPLPEMYGSTTVNGTTCFSTENNATYVPSSCGGTYYQEIVYTNRGVWYTVTIPEGTGTQYMTFSTCNDADFDTAITVFNAMDSSSESCTDGLDCVKAMDDTYGCLTTTELGTNLPGDDTYYILIHGYEGSRGNFNLTVSRDDELITPEPTEMPTLSPTESPTLSPTVEPSLFPTLFPTKFPTFSPTVEPTLSPTKAKFAEPSKSPTASPHRPVTGSPTTSPMSSPNSTSTGAPSVSPSAQPPTAEPSKSPAASPNRPVTGSPTTSPTSSPSSTPTGAPSVSPSAQPPTSSPMAATLSPSTSPQMAATQAPTLSPETSSLPIAPLNPNPDSFETNAFPTNPWFTSGDGEWSRTTDNAFNGTFSMKSPNFTGSDVPLFANATLLLGSNYRGGSCSFHYYASVSAPHDMLRVYVDGEVGKEILYADGTDPNVWKQSGIGLPPGEHEIVFSYQYNVFGLGDRLKEIPRPSLFEIEGTVWIDNVFIFEVSSKENG